MALLLIVYAAQAPVAGRFLGMEEVVGSTPTCGSGRMLDEDYISSTLIIPTIYGDAPLGRLHLRHLLSAYAGIVQR